ncbi:ribonuclease H [Senna tora]|uniref:Ribonuclease H n=1 Tax=Senna tora TaxID=362788 RepID=A0A834XAN4_9FABA|nr:ribonuclease H [Senna tora]
MDLTPMDESPTKIEEVPSEIVNLDDQRLMANEEGGARRALWKDDKHAQSYKDKLMGINGKFTDVTSLHALRDCNLVKPLWQKLVNNTAQHDFFNLSLQEWNKFNLQNKIGMNPNILWGSMFGTACWMIWKQRKDWVFNDKKEEANSLMNLIELNVMNWLNTDKLNSNRGILYHESFVTWKPPIKGWIKVITDGSYNHCINKLSCGAVIRNDKGEWLMGLAKPMGSGIALQPEICGIILGLEMAWKHGMKKVIMETDSTEAFDFAQDFYDKNHPLRFLAEKIKEYKDKNWQVVLKHTFRETNRVADFLAKYARNRNFEDCFLISPPDECIELVKDDAQGLGFWRV